MLARTLRGIEWIAEAEIRALLGASEIEHGHRELRFTLPELSPALLDLGTVDDVFLVLGVVDGVGRTRDSLARLAAGAAAVDLSDAAALVSGLRDVRGRSFDVVGSFLGRRNFSRNELEDAFGPALATASGWSYSSRTAGDPARGALSLRVHVQDSRATVATRIAAAPLHRRPYRVASRPGSLHPPLARSLSLLAGLRPEAVLVDPFCGAGTIPIEAKLACPRISAAGLDLDDEALAAARLNASAAGLELDLALADAAALPLADGSADRLVTNPPWGSAVGAGGTAGRDPAAFRSELLRVLAPEGRVAFVTAPGTPFDRLARTGLQILVEERVRVSGAVVSLLVLARPESAQEAFDAAGLYGPDLAEAASNPSREPPL